MKITIEWKHAEKNLKVEVECDDALVGWEEHCAKKIAGAIKAAEAGVKTGAGHVEIE